MSASKTGGVTWNEVIHPRCLSHVTQLGSGDNDPGLQPGHPSEGSNPSVDTSAADLSGPAAALFDQRGAHQRYAYGLNVLPALFGHTLLASPDRVGSSTAICRTAGVAANTMATREQGGDAELQVPFYRTRA